MNKLEVLNHPIKNLPSGDQLHVKVFRIQSEVPGPHVYIQSSVHGSEVQGNAVIYELLSYFTTNSFKGSVTLVPFCNPQANLTKIGTSTLGRFNPITGHNWNRNFVDILSIDEELTGFNLEDFVEENKKKSPQEIKINFKKRLFEAIESYQKSLFQYGPNLNNKFNLTLQKLSVSSDIVLDLHTGPVATRYLYCPEFQKESARHFRFPFTLLIPDEFDGAMDESTFTPWSRLTKALKNKDIEFENPFESYTVELGSEEKVSFSEAKEDANRILNYLKYKNVVDDFNSLSAQNQYACYLKDYKTYYSPKSGISEFCVSPGEFFQKDDTLFKTLSFSSINNNKDLEKGVHPVKALNDGILINHCPSAITHEGMEMVQVFENYFTF